LGISGITSLLCRSRKKLEANHAVNQLSSGCLVRVGKTRGFGLASEMLFDIAGG
jgi:hypothetical protein